MGRKLHFGHGHFRYTPTPTRTLGLLRGGGQEVPSQKQISMAGLGACGGPSASQLAWCSLSLVLPFAHSKVMSARPAAPRAATIVSTWTTAPHMNHKRG